MARRTTQRSFLSLATLSPQDLGRIGEAACSFGRSADEHASALTGARVGLVFTAPSTRTRISFWSAARTLGCDVLPLGATDLQVTTGESWSDTGRILAEHLDAVVVRTNGPQDELDDLAGHLPTINALTNEEHPTQAIADFCALQEHFGTVSGLRIAYVGAVNNTARSLAQLAYKSSVYRIDVYSPIGHGFAPAEVRLMNADAGSECVRQFAAIPASPDPVDVVYTTRWQSMSSPRHDRAWLETFSEFKVDGELMARFSGPTAAVFMHDLPAVRELEVASEVLDGVSATSLVTRQTYHKASAAAAALLWSLGGLG